MNIVKLHSTNTELRIGDTIQYSTSNHTDTPECIADITMSDRGVIVTTVDVDNLPCRYTLAQLDQDFLAVRMTKVTEDIE